MNQFSNSIKKALYKYNPIGAFFYLYKQNKELKKDLATWKVGQWEPGHYYTPQVLPNQVKDSQTSKGKALLGIEMREKEQWAFIQQLYSNYPDLDLPKTKQEGKRYYLQNGYFYNSDAIFLALVLQHFKPARVIEIGSGFSSALMLDINESKLGNKTSLTFIEPYPDRLKQLIGANENCTVIEDFVQNADISLFANLEKDDILFVDSSHVSKYGSDVNFILFNILPLLKPGVIVHFHDIFYPFEYPKEWIQGGRFWNEAYLLRAFLQFNQDFELLLFTSYLENEHKEWFTANMPICLEVAERGLDGEYINTIFGKSIYIRRKELAAH